MKPVRVLIAEDEVGVARLLQVLMRRKGYDTQICGDGVQAMKCITEHHPDLILLDLIMPVMSGYDLLRELKQDPATSRIPVVLVTTDENLSQIETEAQGVEHVTKPFAPHHLDEAVERALAAAQAGSAGTN